MRIAVIAFDGFNEIDTLAPVTILGQLGPAGWRASIASSSPRITSKNGVILNVGISLEEVAEVDVVIVSSGTKSREVAANPKVLGKCRLNPSRQLIGAQCSGALILANLGFLKNMPACTDLKTKSWLQDAGVKVLNQPFFAQGHIATAGGCLASQYLSGWIIASVAGVQAAADALTFVAPVGEKEQYVSRALSHIIPFVSGPFTGNRSHPENRK